MTKNRNIEKNKTTTLPLAARNKFQELQERLMLHFNYSYYTMHLLIHHM